MDAWAQHRSKGVLEPALNPVMDRLKIDSLVFQPQHFFFIIRVRACLEAIPVPSDLNTHFQPGSHANAHRRLASHFFFALTMTLTNVLIELRWR